MKLGFVTLQERGATDAFLADIAASLQASGMAVAGAVQINSDPACRHDCDMDLQILPDGPVVRISQQLGKGSTGCRLDTGALETTVMEVGQRMPAAQVLIINKFGKYEAEGRGFRPLLAEALSAGIPCLIGINSMNRQAFLDFAGDLAEAVEATEGAVQTWFARALHPA